MPIRSECVPVFSFVYEATLCGGGCSQTSAGINVNQTFYMLWNALDSLFLCLHVDENVFKIVLLWMGFIF